MHGTADRCAFHSDAGRLARQPQATDSDDLIAAMFPATTSRPSGLLRPSPRAALEGLNAGGEFPAEMRRNFGFPYDLARATARP